MGWRASHLFKAVDRWRRNVGLLPFRFQCALRIRSSGSARHPLAWDRRRLARAGAIPCPEFSPEAQDRLTLGQMLFAQETYPTSDPKDYRLGNCYFHQDL